jgi:hypothetical protein
MVMWGTGFVAISLDTYYELSVYDVSTHNKIIRVMTSGRGVFWANTRMSDRTTLYRSCSAPGFAFAWLWRCCFELPGDAESCCGSGNGTGSAMVGVGVAAVGTESRQL